MKKGKRHTEEEKIKIRESCKKYFNSVAGRNVLIEGAKKRPKASRDTCKKISESLKGHACSEETREKIRQAHLGKPAWNKGLTKSVSESVNKNASATSKTIQKMWNEGHYQDYVKSGMFKKSQKTKDKLRESHSASGALKGLKTRHGLETDDLFEIKQEELEKIIKDFKQEGYLPVNLNSFIGTKKCVDVICPQGHSWKIRINDWRSGYRCRTCSKMVSNQEKEVSNFVKSLVPSAQENSRPAFMKGKELDIYIPELNLAIEYCGLFWHTTQWKKEPNYHREKFILCRDHGVSLITIFSDEWLNKKELIKKMIEYRLGKLQAIKIRGSDCEIRPISMPEQKEFFNLYHASGYSRSLFAYGLYYGDILITGLTFRKPYAVKEKGTIEICRLANNYNYMVYGGFSKLLKVAATELSRSFNKLITYSDCRFGQGEVYKKNGFTYVRHSPPNYWYTKGEVREFRFKHRRQDKLNHLGKTEKEQTEEQGFFAIYDCGHYKWEMNLAPLALPST